MFKICRQAFCEKSDYINENVSIESRRNERVESLKDSNILDCHEATPLAMTKIWIHFIFAILWIASSLKGFAMTKMARFHAMPLAIRSYGDLRNKIASPKMMALGRFHTKIAESHNDDLLRIYLLA